MKQKQNMVAIGVVPADAQVDVGALAHMDAQAAAPAHVLAVVKVLVCNLAADLVLADAVVIATRP